MLMLNRYQENVVEFFRAYSGLFVKSLLISLPEKFSYVDDVYPRMIDFIDNQIKKEMALHDRRSEGYNRFLDMLIEIHAPEASDAFKAAMVNEVNAVFRN